MVNNDLVLGQEIQLGGAFAWPGFHFQPQNYNKEESQLKINK
jgi:hypothetical protein